MLRYRVMWLGALLALMIGGMVFVPDLDRVTQSYTLAVLIIAAISLVAFLVQTILGAQQHVAAADVVRLMKAPRSARIKVLGFSAIWLLYPLMMLQIGFILSTTAALALSMFAVRPAGRWWLYLVFSLVGSALIFVFITYLLYIPVPTSAIEDGISHLFYQLR